MKVHRMDHVSLNVNDLQAAKSFFMDLVLGLTDVKTACVGLGTP